MSQVSGKSIKAVVNVPTVTKAQPNPGQIGQGGCYTNNIVISPNTTPAEVKESE